MENWTRVSRLRPWHVAVFCAAIFMAGMMAPTLTTAQSSSKEEVYRQLGLFGDIFQRVRESTEDFPDGWTNLAHMYVAEKEYFQAIKLYEKCHKKFYGNADVSLLQYIARAYYDWAREQQDKGDLETAAEKMRDCQRHVEKSLHLDPSHHISWFNLAVAKLQAASYVIKQAEPSEPDVRQAIGELEQAKKLFAALGEHSCSEKELGFKKAKAVENVNSCDNKSNDAAETKPPPLARLEVLGGDAGLPAALARARTMASAY